MLNRRMSGSTVKTADQPAFICTRFFITSYRHSRSAPLRGRLLLPSVRYQDVNSTLYFAVLCRHTYECMPFVYTPVVGEACQKFSRIYRHTPQASKLVIMGMDETPSTLRLSVIVCGVEISCVR